MSKAQHTRNLKRAGLATFDTLVARIVRTFDRATSADVESGARWYDDAGLLAKDLGRSSGHGLQHAAAVIAHLSPRTSWSRNVATAIALLAYGPEEARDMGAMSALVDRAMASLDYADAFESFGPAARKTASFARNIAGDREAVTVDVWAARVAGVDETLLGRVGIYDAVADAYREAARRRSVDPATMQATTWIVQRGGRAS